MNTAETLTPSKEITSIDDLDFSRRYTIGDFLQWKFDDLVELIRGKVFKMSPAPNVWHQRVVSDLQKIFYKKAEVYEEKGCEFFPAPTNIFLAKAGQKLEEGNIVVEPDFSITCNETKVIKKGYVGAPDFLVEVLSPSNAKRDLVYKRELYEEFQVPEFWIVNPAKRRIVRHIYSENGFYKTISNKEGDVIAPLQFPEIQVDLKKVFQRIPPAEEQ